MASGGHYATISFIQRILASFRKRLMPKEEDPCYIRDMKKAMQADLEKRYTDERIRDIIDISAALDPRFKSHTSEITKNNIIGLTEKLNEDDYYNNLSQIPGTQSQNLDNITMFPPTNKTQVINCDTTIEDDIFGEEEDNITDCTLNLQTLRQKYHYS